MISLKFLSLLIDGPTETVKKEIKKQKCGFLDAMMAPMVASLIAPVSSSLIQPVASSWTNALSEKVSWEQKKNKKMESFHYYHYL